MFSKFNKVIASVVVCATAVFFVSCQGETIPKPKGQLRLEYPLPEYKVVSGENPNCKFSFEVNKQANVVFKDDCALELQYPKMKATIYLNYKVVNNDIEKHLRDAQKLTYNHVIKADDILEQPFINHAAKAYGMFYQIGGNAATNAQFYVTDSTRNFLMGSAYFYAKPNFDSILPAADYVKKDMRRILETINWKK